MYMHITWNASISFLYVNKSQDIIMKLCDLSENKYLEVEDYQM